MSEYFFQAMTTNSGSIEIPLANALPQGLPPEFGRGGQLVTWDDYLAARTKLTRAVSPSGTAIYDDSVRNVDFECGYAHTDRINAARYRGMYERDPIAARVIEVYPNECWQVEPQVFESEDEDETVFEGALREMSQALDGGTGLQANEGNPLWQALEEFDIMCGIGRYGVLLLGLDDGRGLDEPVEKRQGMELRYIRAFDEGCAKISSYEQDETSERFGLPKTYELTIRMPTGGMSDGTQKSLEVHHDRIIHFYDGISSNKVLGQPRCQSVHNRLYDLHKLYGGSAEMYWQGAFFGLGFEMDPDIVLTLDKADRTALVKSMGKQMEKYRGGLQRHLMLQGQKVNSLSPQVVSPAQHIDKHLEAICVKIQVPKRVFLGSERGELASGQDADAWTKRVGKRQNRTLTPRVIAPLIDRLVTFGVLPEPTEDGYSVVWPDLTEQNKSERAEVASKTTDALAKYVAGDVEAILPPMQYLTMILGLTREEAAAVLEEAEEWEEEHRDEEDHVHDQGENDGDSIPPDVPVSTGANTQEEGE